ncbi:MAG: hypothetical protein AAB920_01700 [Patescibacteria group bacterium]
MKTTQTQLFGSRFLLEEHTDLIVRDEERGYAIELKYKKTEIDIINNGERFVLRPDLARDIGRYGFIKDVVRLEKFTSEFTREDKAFGGYAIMLTNDRLYWDGVAGGNGAEFSLCEGRQINNGKNMKWHPRTARGARARRSMPLNLSGNYKIHWEDYSKISDLEKGNQFRYLLLKINK